MRDRSDKPRRLYFAFDMRGRGWWWVVNALWVYAELAVFFASFVCIALTIFFAPGLWAVFSFVGLLCVLAWAFDRLDRRFGDWM